MHFALVFIAHISSVRTLTVSVNTAVLQDLDQKGVEGNRSLLFCVHKCPRSNLKKDSFSSPTWKEVLVAMYVYTVCSIP